MVPEQKLPRTDEPAQTADALATTPPSALKDKDPVTLTELSQDLFLIMSRYLPPRDIIALRRSCWTLNMYLRFEKFNQHWKGRWDALLHFGTKNSNDENYAANLDYYRKFWERLLITLDTSATLKKKRKFLQCFSGELALLPETFKGKQLVELRDPRTPDPLTRLTVLIASGQIELLSNPKVSAALRAAGPDDKIFYITLANRFEHRHVVFFLLKLLQPRSLYMSYRMEPGNNVDLLQRYSADGDVEMVTAVLEYAEIPSYYNDHPVLLAYRAGHYEVCQVLLESQKLRLHTWFQALVTRIARDKKWDLFNPLVAKCYARHSNARDYYAQALVECAKADDIEGFRKLIEYCPDLYSLRNSECCVMKESATVKCYYYCLTTAFLLHDKTEYCQLFLDAQPAIPGQLHHQKLNFLLPVECTEATRLLKVVSLMENPTFNIARVREFITLAATPPASASTGQPPAEIRLPAVNPPEHVEDITELRQTVIDALETYQKIWCDPEERVMSLIEDVRAATTRHELLQSITTQIRIHRNTSAALSFDEAGHFYMMKLPSWPGRYWKILQRLKDTIENYHDEVDLSHSKSRIFW